MQYLTENLALNGVDLRRIYRWFCDYKGFDPMDYLLTVVGCTSTWTGATLEAQYLRPEQPYNSSATYNVRITAYNLVDADQSVQDLMKNTATVKYVKYADGSYSVGEPDTGV